jgi:glycosidase
MSNPRSWLKTAVIYNLVIDRFARGQGANWQNEDAHLPVFCGGDLQGVIDKLDYLQELGVNTILLTPFHPTSAYHGYHTLDLFGVDERFGEIATLRRLIEEAHSRGFHVMMDFVMGHISSQHPYFVDARANHTSKYHDWFLFSDWPDGYLAFLNFYDLPKLNLDNPEVKEHIFAAARMWLDLGIDGLRLDHVVGIPHRFLRQLHRVLRKEHPQAVLLAEAVQGKFRWSELKTLKLRYKLFLYILGQFNFTTTFFVQLQYSSLMDGVLDFYFRDLVMSFMLRPVWYKPLWLMKLLLKFHYALYPKSFGLISLLDNADDDRFNLFAKNDDATYKKILNFQFQQKHPALIYYGSEVGLKQTESRQHKAYGDKSHGDVHARALMPWNNIDLSWFKYYQQLIKHRATLKQPRHQKPE